MRVKCAECGSGLNAPENAAGRRARCPTCKAVFVIPSGQEAAQPTVQELPASPEHSAAPAQPAGAPPLAPDAASRALAGVILLLECGLLAAMVICPLVVWRRESDSLRAQLLLWGWMVFIYSNCFAFALYEKAGGGRRGMAAVAGMLFLGLLAGPLVSGRLSLVLGLALTITAIVYVKLSRVPGLAGGGPDGETEGLPTAQSRTFVPLVLISLVLSVVVGLVAGVQATFSAAWGGEPPILAYPYLLISVVALGLALYEGRRARTERDASRRRRAALLAMAGGLQHAALVGLPAIVAGIMAIKKSPAPERSGPYSHIGSMLAGGPFKAATAMAAVVIMLSFCVVLAAPDEATPVLALGVMPLTAIAFGLLSGRLLGSAIVAAAGQASVFVGYFLGGQPLRAGELPAILVTVAGTCGLALIAAALRRWWVRRRPRPAG